MSSFELAALDLDGTLVDSAPDLCFCLGQALADFGLTAPDLAETHSWIGDGVQVLVRRALASRLGHEPESPVFEQALSRFQACYRERLYVDSVLYPAVPETLTTLAGAGIRLGCITNKPEAFAVDLLERAGISGQLDFIYGADTFPAKKPDPMPLIKALEAHGAAAGRSVMVGDSINDLKASRAAGYGFVFARYGYADPDDTDLLAGTGWIGAFSELPELLSGR